MFDSHRETSIHAIAASFAIIQFNLPQFELIDQFGDSNLSSKISNSMRRPSKFWRQVEPDSRRRTKEWPIEPLIDRNWFELPINQSIGHLISSSRRGLSMSFERVQKSSKTRRCYGCCCCSLINKSPSCHLHLRVFACKLS